MKKARIMLSAIAVVGIVAGAFAFTAKRSTTVYYTGTSSTSCPNKVTGINTTASVGGTIFVTTDVNKTTSSCVAVTTASAPL